MAKVKAPRPDDVLRLGEQVATIKASMPAARWKKFVKMAHARGHTIGAALSDRPDALKERTASSLRAEAAKTVNTAYAPAEKELSQRQAAIGFLDEKRKADDASYRTWLEGEVGKINAQATAADTALGTQQANIQTETETAIAAARADSLKRMAATGGVSDPNQSTALDTSEADAASLKRVGQAREHTAAIVKIGGDARALASQSLLAQQAAREGTRQGETMKAMNEVGATRSKLASDKGASLADKITEALSKNAQIAEGNREADLAAASLGLKEKDLAQQVVESQRKYKVELKKFGLEQWKADNADKVARLKVQLGYDQITSSEGKAEADRKLRAAIEKERDKDRDLDRDARGKDKDEKKGVTQDERDLYKDVTTALGLLKRWHANGRVKDMRHELRNTYGVPDVIIDVAEDLRRNGGTPSDAGRAAARRAGIKHTGYFWKPLSNKTQPSGDAGR